MGQGVEDAVCGRFPYVALEVFPSYVTFSGIIAGFGVAGFLLMLERVIVNETPTELAQFRRQERFSSAAFLFAVSAINSLIACYMFSAASGDSCLLAQVEFGYPGVVLAVGGVTMVAAIGTSMSAVEAFPLPASFVQLFVGILATLVVLRLAVDLDHSAAVAEGLDLLEVEELSEVDARFTELEPRDTDTAVARRINSASARPETKWMMRFVLAAWPVGVATTILRARKVHGLPDRSMLVDERRWRSAVAGTTVVATISTVVLFSVDTGLGGGLPEPSAVRWPFLLALLLAPLLVLLASPTTVEARACGVGWLREQGSYMRTRVRRRVGGWLGGSYAGRMTDGENTESTEDLVEGTKEAREAAEEALQEAHAEAEELEERLESEGLTPDTDQG